jgi:predicted metal-binding protein
MTRKFMVDIPAGQVQGDMEKYRKYAIEMGATDAKIIPTSDIVIDERVVAKCTYPKCPGYGASANCPPHAMPIDQVRKVVEKFNYALFIKIDIPPEETAGKTAIRENLAHPYRKKLFEIISKIESQAFYDGYHLALGFAGGSCKRVFCPDDDCTALKPGKGCPHRLKARSPMEAVGMDVYTMATRAGWDIYPIGMNTLAEDVPHGLRLGIVLIH